MAARVLLLISLAACGAPNVGAACGGNASCDDGLVCNSAFTGGYCTKACTVTGTQSGCPEGSICDSVTGAGTVCVAICKTTVDCRSPLECNGVSGSNVKACKPK